jgi:hypothetical protein
MIILCVGEREKVGCTYWGKSLRPGYPEPTAPHNFVHVTDKAGPDNDIEELPTSETRGGSTELFGTGRWSKAIELKGLNLILCSQLGLLAPASDH